MAATNYTPIQLYFSTTASAVPLAANLAQGELAINITDGKLYYEDNAGVVQVIATKGAGTIGGSTTQIQYNNAGALAGNAAMTFNSGTSTTTLTTLNLTNALGATYGGTAQSAYAQGDFLYASATNTLSKLSIGTVNYILTSTGSVPQWSAPSSIIVQTATNLAGGLGGSVPYQSAVDTTTFLAIGAANRVMTSSGTAPQWVTSLTGLTGVSSSSITNTSLTSGRVVYSGASGVQTDDADLTFDGTTLSAGGYSTVGLTTLVKTVKIGDSNFNGVAVFAPSTPAKLYIGTGTVTDTTSAIGATNATGAVASLAITPIAATNTSVTYTNAATLYIAGAPSAGTNVTLTNPYSLYVAAGDAYFGGTVTAGTVNLTTLDLTNLEVTNIKAKDGTASITLADSTGVASLTANPVLSGGTANGLTYLNGSKVLSRGSARTYNGTNLLTFTHSSDAYLYVVSSGNAAGHVSLRGAGANASYGAINNYRTDNSTQNWQIGGIADQGVLPFFAGSTEGMRLTSTGLGIGTSSPAYKLDIAVAGTASYSSSSAPTPNIFLGTTGVANSRYTSIGINCRGTSGQSQTNYITSVPEAADGNAALAFSTYGSYAAVERMRITSVGVLDVSANDSVIAYFRSSGGLANDKQFAIRSGGDRLILDASNNSTGTATALVFATGGTEQMRLTTTGLGVGMTPAAKLDVTNGASPASRLRVGVGAGAASTLYSTLAAGDYVSFETNAVERVRINSTGDFIVGPVGGNGNGVVKASDASGTNQPGSNLLLKGGDGGGTGSSYVALFTAPGGSSGSSPSASVERMRITAAGNVGIGTLTPATKLDVRGTSATTGSTVQIVGESVSSLLLGQNADGGVIRGQGGNNALSFWTGGLADLAASGSGSERARIDSSGNFMVGATATASYFDGKLNVFNAGVSASFKNSVDTLPSIIAWNATTTGDAVFVAFATEVTVSQRGSITYNRAGGLTVYNTTSDYRAKDISGPVTNSGALIDSIPVYMGKMKDATQERPMFIAHETPPYAHTGEKDAIDADGNPVYQQMDASALIPVMWAEIQSLRKRLADAGI